MWSTAARNASPCPTCIRPAVAPLNATPDRCCHAALSTMSATISNWRAMPDNAAISTRVAGRSPMQAMTPARHRRFHPDSALVADRFGDPDRDLPRGVYVGGLHHHSHDLLGS